MYRAEVINGHICPTDRAAIAAEVAERVRVMLRDTRVCPGDVKLTVTYEVELDWRVVPLPADAADCPVVVTIGGTENAEAAELAAPG